MAGLGRFSNAAGLGERTKAAAKRNNAIADKKKNKQGIMQRVKGALSIASNEKRNWPTASMGIRG